jgi:hypothetical protein
MIHSNFDMDQHLSYMSIMLLLMLHVIFFYPTCLYKKLNNYRVIFFEINHNKKMILVLYQIIIIYECIVNLNVIMKMHYI